MVSERTPGDTVALIVAAGRGARFGAAPPKQYRSLRGRPVLARSVRAFLRHPEVDRVVVVIHRGDRELYDEAVREFDLCEPVTGGATRQQSVRHGLEALVLHPPRHVLIHDAARPLVGASAISGTLAALAHATGAVAALPVRDTVKRVVDGDVVETVPREALWLAQTPQAFRFADILAAHRAARDVALTDDAAVAERAGLRVVAVESGAGNLKLTMEEDLILAERALPVGIRVGSGFDAHRFTASGDHVVLCGVTVPHDKGLAGHSDADTALHAVVDALLGAVAAGDIGVFFPSHETAWAGADSACFVRRACDIVSAARGRILHIDVTVICERPRLAPYRASMRKRLAGLLGLPEGAVSVKASTTDGMGFTGRGEGVAAQATATVEVAA